MLNQLTITITDDETGDECEHKVPGMWAICSHCEGNGASSAYLGAITQSERAEWDPEEWQGYMAGRYDRRCSACNGSGKVLVPDTQDAATAELVATWEAQEQRRAEWDAEDAAVYRMESGGY